MMCVCSHCCKTLLLFKFVNVTEEASMRVAVTLQTTVTLQTRVAFDGGCVCGLYVCPPP